MSGGRRPNRASAPKAHKRANTYDPSSFSSQTARSHYARNRALRLRARKRSRSRNERWFLYLAGGIVSLIVLLVALLAWINRPIEITVDGEKQTVRIGSTVDEAFTSEHVEVKSGDYVSVMGRILKAGAGHEYAAKCDGDKLNPPQAQERRLFGGEKIKFSDGEDIMEDYDVKKKQVAPYLTTEGTGTTVEYVSQWGKAGELEVRTGKESGETAEVTTVEPVPCIITGLHLRLDSEESDGKKYVALTFDDGPAAPYTDEYLKILKKYDVKATFFDLGDNINQYPSLAKKVVKAGHQLGNYTMAHESLVDEDADKIKAAIDESAAVVESITGEPAAHLRPPFGQFDTNSWIASGGSVSAVIRWSADSQDWRLPGADAIVENSLADIHSGSIILMNEGGGDRSQNLEALPRLIEYLQAEGYEFVTIADLLRQVGTIPEDVCSGTATMPKDAAWPEELAPPGYYDEDE